MGNALVCFEGGNWDSHHHVRARYKPRALPPQDMTQPLSHYFISSGHNSYLEGNQLTSNAGTATIESGLRLGCRVIELDVYDGPNEQPICTHGGTLTSTLKFLDAVKAIAKHGFHASPYPVILTIENHAGMEQQAVMASDLHRVLGSHLFQPEPDQLEKDGKWLSPDALKHKVIIRMKVKHGATAPELARLVYIRNTKIAGYEVSTGPAAPSSHSLPDSKLPAVSEYAEFVRSSSAGDQSAKAGSSSVSAAFRDMKSAVKSAAGSLSSPVSSGSVSKVSAGGVESAAAATEDFPAAAIAEKELMLDAEMDDTIEFEQSSSGTAGAQLPYVASAAQNGDVLPTGLSSPPLSKVFEYTSKHLLRCYPGGWRMINNSNPNPARAWSLGASLAALNWQLWDEPIWINQAFFSQRNYSGYVLKPTWMTSAGATTALPESTARTLRVTVYSAHVHQGNLVGITKDDPYVELKIHGLPCDSNTLRTEHANDTGRLVVDKTLDLTIRYPEMAVLVVLLKDLNIPHADEVLGYAALPLATLAVGEFKLQLAEPYVCSEHCKQPRDMWVKVKFEWGDALSPAATAAAPPPPPPPEAAAAPPAERFS